MVKFGSITAARIAEVVGGKIAFSRNQGGEESKATHLGEPLEVSAEGVAFIISESFVRDAAATKASILVVQAALLERVQQTLSADVKVVVSAPDAYLGLAELSRVIAESDALFDWRPGKDDSGKSVSGLAEVDSSAVIGRGAVVCDGAKIGARTVILPNAVVGPGVSIGSDCVIFPGVVLYPRTNIGNRVRIHANAVLGSDGFGYARGPQGSVKIWHLGKVVVGDDVEIGAGTMIDKGTMKDTIIEKGAKLDNLVQIGHNGHVKAHAILCAQVGMAGNVTIGRGAILAGKVGVADKLEIGDGALIGPMSGLSKDVKAGEQVMGSHPAKPRREWWKLIVLVEKLPDIYDRLKKLEAKFEGKKS